MGATDCLYEPIQLGPKRAKNRIMRVATTANLADANKAGPRLLAFYRAVAKGGAGTIVTEAMRTQPQDPFGPAALTIFDRAAIPALRNLSDVCHAEGALLIGQLAMGGRLVIPVGRGDAQELVSVTRSRDGFESMVLDNVKFVPLLPGAY